MKFSVGILSFLVLLGICFTGSIAMAQEKTVFKTIKDVPQQKWESLAQKKIFFAHQSVGFNIIDGIKDIMAENPQISLNILDEAPNGELASGVFFHAKVGENRQPETKIAAFINVVDQQMQGDLDAAFLKFCYVDAKKDTDVVKLFEKYQKAVRNLQAKYPALKIIHFTMPLRTQPITWKAKLKMLVGKELWELADNIKRNEFNSLLLQEYQGKEPVFDIARFEATALDGSVTGFKYRGTEYLAMNPGFSNDGGHLNKLGSKVIAERLILFLVNVM